LNVETLQEKQVSDAQRKYVHDNIQILHKPLGPYLILLVGYAAI
jgi:hypothetical protein